MFSLKLNIIKMGDFIKELINKKYIDLDISKIGDLFYLHDFENEFQNYYVKKQHYINQLVLNFIGSEIPAVYYKLKTEVQEQELIVLKILNLIFNQWIEKNDQNNQGMLIAILSLWICEKTNSYNFEKFLRDNLYSHKENIIEKLNLYLNEKTIKSLLKKFDNEIINKLNLNEILDFPVPKILKLVVSWIDTERRVLLFFDNNDKNKIQNIIENSKDKSFENINIIKLFEQGKELINNEFDGLENEREIISYLFNFRYGNYCNELFSLLIGFLLFKNEKQKIQKIFKKLNDFKNSKKFKEKIKENNQFYLNDIFQDVELTESEKQLIEVKKDYLNLNFSSKESLIYESEKFLKNEFKEMIESFLNNYYGNNWNKESFNDFINQNYLIKNGFCNYWHIWLSIIKDNWNVFASKKLDKLIYRFIYTYEMNSRNKNVSLTDSNDLSKSIIKNNYDEKIIYDLSDKYLREYQNFFDFKKINPIVFVDNNLLSKENRFVFAKYEKAGDKIYDLIINFLIFENKIKKINSNFYFTKYFQTKLCQSLNLSKIIQSNNLHFGSEETYSDADYFEALLFSIFEQKFSFNNLKKFIFKLFEQNASNFILIDKFESNIVKLIGNYFNDDQNNLKELLSVPDYPEHQFNNLNVLSKIHKKTLEFFGIINNNTNIYIYDHFDSKELEKTSWYLWAVFLKNETDYLNLFDLISKNRNNN